MHVSSSEYVGLLFESALRLSKDSDKVIFSKKLSSSLLLVLLIHKDSLKVSSFP